MTFALTGLYRDYSVIVLEVSCHVVVQIVNLNFVAEAVCVCEQKPRSVTSVSTLYVIAVKIVHEHFRQL